MPRRRGRRRSSSPNAPQPDPTACLRSARRPASSGGCSRGSIIIAVFVILALFAPLDRALRLRRRPRPTASTSPSCAPPSAALVRHQRLRATTCCPGSSRARGPRSRSSCLGRPAVDRRSACRSGLISGFLGGWVDRVLVLHHRRAVRLPVPAAGDRRLVPPQRTSAAAASSRPPLSITVVYVPQYFRVVRNATVAAREEPYVEAARALGAPPCAIMRRYLFGNVVQSVPVIATLNAADAILTLAGLGFLGFGIEPTPAAEWGYDLNRALSTTPAGIWWTGVLPRPGHRAAGRRADAGRREPQRRAQPALRRRRLQTLSTGRAPRREPEEAVPK